MPTRSGASHALSAFVVLLGGTSLGDYVELSVDATDIAATVDALAFLWGVAFYKKMR
ncbi:hypothetical protein [Haloarchaeobius sp. DT45]|uniref:hypothetical protein n=1 Tax=Haloarchaeobius sp. DT45 TaxID=3446116 RepID=UPI003F6ABF29